MGWACWCYSVLVAAGLRGNSHVRFGEKSRGNDPKRAPRRAAYSTPSLLDSAAAKLSATTDPGHHLDIDHSRGRVVHRQIWTTDAAGIDFPGAAQVFRIRRDVFNLCGQRVSKEIVHGITSLTEATAEAVARWVRQYWGVENRIHWVRDVVFAEDHQNAYLGAAAHAWPCSATSRSAPRQQCGRARKLPGLPADQPVPFLLHPWEPQAAR